MTQENNNPIPRRIDISMEELISAMDFDKETRENLYMQVMQVTPEQGKVIWKEDKIEGFKLFKALEKLEFTITIDPNGE